MNSTTPRLNGDDSGSCGFAGHSPDACPRGLAFVICAVLAAITWVVFGQTVTFDFVNYDDDKVLVGNQAIEQGITWTGIKWAFTDTQLGHWGPLTTISHMLDCQFFGMEAGGHHFTNLVLHTVAAILLFVALFRMTGAFWPAAIVAAIFAIHPLRAESVAWVTERKDVLSGLFFMLTLLAYERYARHPWSLARYMVVVAFLTLGLLSKSMLVTAPFVLLLLDWWPLQRMPQVRLSRLILEKLPLLALSVAAAAVQFRVAMEDGIIASGEYLSLVQRLGNALAAYAAYLKNSFYPVNLAVLYPHPGNALGILTVAMAFLGLAGLSAGVFFRWRTMPWLAVGWLWFLGMLVPVIGIVQAGELAMADRYTYLPQIGLSIALVWSIARFCRSSPALRGIVQIAGPLAIAALMFLAYRQTSHWRNSETLWAHGVACTAGNATAHNQLGMALAGRGATEQAFAHYRTALQLRPHYAAAHNNLGLILVGRGQFDEAIEHYRKAIDKAENQDRPLMYSNLGVALAGRGETSEAILHYEKALALDPNLAVARNNLGLALARLGQVDDAAAQYRKAIASNPGYAKAWNNLGILLAERGDIEAAIVHFQRAVGVRPDFAEAHNNLGLAFVRVGRPAEAIAHFEKALEINPGFDTARRHLDQARRSRR